MQCATDGRSPTYISVFSHFQNVTQLSKNPNPAPSTHSVLLLLIILSSNCPCIPSFMTRWTPCWRPWRGRSSGCGSLPLLRRRWRKSGSSWQSTEPRGWSWTNCCQASPPSVPAERSSSDELLMTILLLRVSGCDVSDSECQSSN